MMNAERQLSAEEICNVLAFRSPSLRFAAVMEFFRNRTGRCTRHRSHRTGSLPGQPLPSFVLALALSSLFAPAFSVSCTRVPCIEEEIQPDPAPETPDSTCTHLTLTAEGPVSKIDLLIYDGSGMATLDSHVSYRNPSASVDIQTTIGTKAVLAIANCPYTLNLKALDRLESALQMVLEFNDDDPMQPIMTGYSELEAGSGAEIHLEPFLCRVTLTEISNAMDDYELVEEPRIWLSELNPSVTVLQDREFRPVDFIPEGEPESLPYDIGLFTQYPETVLYCYPNDTPERELGAPHTSLNLECRIRGEACTASFTLPPMGRNSTTRISVTIFSADDIKFETLN